MRAGVRRDEGASYLVYDLSVSVGVVYNYKYLFRICTMFFV